MNFMIQKLLSNQYGRENVCVLKQQEDILRYLQIQKVDLIRNMSKNIFLNTSLNT